MEARLKSDANRPAGIVSALGLSSLLPDPRMVNERETAVSPEEADRILADFKAAIADSVFAPAAFEPYENFLREVLRAKQAPTIADLRQYPERCAQFSSDSTLDQRGDQHRVRGSPA